MVKGRVVKQRYKAAMAAKAAAPNNYSSNSGNGTSKNAKRDLSDEEDDRPKRAIRKTAADSVFGGGTYTRNSFAPELPSVLASNGMTMRAARRVRNAWLARIRRLKKRGVDHDDAVIEASRRTADRARDGEVAVAEKIVMGLNKQGPGSKSLFAKSKSSKSSKPARSTITKKTPASPTKSTTASSSRGPTVKSPRVVRPKAVAAGSSRPSVTPSPPPPPSPPIASPRRPLEKGKGKAKEASPKKVLPKEVVRKTSINAANFYPTGSEHSRVLEASEYSDESYESSADGFRSTYKGKPSKIVSASSDDETSRIVFASSDEDDSDDDSARGSLRKDWIRPSGARNVARPSSRIEGTGSALGRSSRRSIVIPSKDVPVPIRQRGVSTGTAASPTEPRQPLFPQGGKMTQAERLAHEAANSLLSGPARPSSSSSPAFSSSPTQAARRMNEAERLAQEAAASRLSGPPLLSSGIPETSSGSARRMTQTQLLVLEATTSRLPGSLGRQDSKSDAAAKARRSLPTSYIEPNTSDSELEGDSAHSAWTQKAKSQARAAKAEKRLRTSTSGDEKVKDEPGSKRVKTSKGSKAQSSPPVAVPSDSDVEQPAPRQINKPRTSTPATTSKKPTASSSSTSKSVSGKMKPRASAPGVMVSGSGTKGKGSTVVSTEVVDPVTGLVKTRKKYVYPDRVCVWCKTSDTGVWRPGPDGAATLCNACGSKWRRHRISKGLIPSPASNKAAKLAQGVEGAEVPDNADAEDEREEEAEEEEEEEEDKQD